MRQGSWRRPADQVRSLVEEAGTLAPLFDPAAIAIVGASQDPTRIGGRPLKYLQQFGYGGRVYPVNPKYRELAGLPCYPDLAAVPGPVDLAIIATPQAAVADALAACIARGVKAAVVFSAGFAETGAAGREAQARLAHQARAAGIRLLGPNCLGTANAAKGVLATFASSLEEGLPPSGDIGFVSQSGAFGSYFMAVARARGMALGLWATTGNEADVQFADCLAYMALEPRVTAIAGYLEGCRDGDRLRAALDLARSRRKPVILLKAGATAAGGRAAASHTGVLAGVDAVYDSIFEEAGAVRVRDLDDLVEMTAAAALGRLPAGARVGILTVSGGAGILMADSAVTAGLEVPELPDETRATIRARIPFAGAGNPVDATAQIHNDSHLLRDLLRLLIERPEIDAIAAFLAHVSQIPSMAAHVVEAIAEAAAASDKPLVMAGTTSPAGAALLARSGVACFTDPVRAVRTLAALRRIALAFDRPPRDGMPRLDAGREAAARALVGAARAKGRRTLPEGAAKAVLRLYGLMAPPDVVVQRPADARAAAEALGGGPFAVKIESPDITHRSDIGGVRLGVPTSAVEEACAAVLASARHHRPEAAIDGVLIQPMLDPGVEVVVGARQDATFGPVVLTGLGGVFVEVLEDTALRTAPVTPLDAAALLRRLRAWPLLAGARGRTPADVAAAAAAISALSCLAADLSDEIAEVEVNPLLVHPEGRGAQASDAVIVLRDRALQSDRERQVRSDQESTHST